MKIVFLSNYFNIHQKNVSDYFYKTLGNDYTFIETSDIPEFRKKLGYSKIETSYVRSMLNKYEIEKCKALINEADCVIFGGAPFDLIRERQKRGKLILVYSERLFKGTDKQWKNILRAIKYNAVHFHRKSEYLLCSSAFAARDYNLIGLFKNRVYRWGYFPECKHYDNVRELIRRKKNSSIVWVARFIQWKNPYGVLQLAQRLKAENYCFSIRMIGTGELEEDIRNKIREFDLDDCIELTGAVSPEKVREYMENSQIFLFTSDSNEGWGAVLNEAMNSACVPVASHAIGSVPYLINDGKNGFIYDFNNIEQMFDKVKFLLDNLDIMMNMQNTAYETIANTWCAEIAAKRIIKVVSGFLENHEFRTDYNDGPLSKAQLLSDDWYQNI